MECLKNCLFGPDDNDNDDSSGSWTTRLDESDQSGNSNPNAIPLSESTGR